MKRKLSFLTLLLLPFLAFSHEKDPEILVQNRILATVNGKNISVYDVMKKMDVFLARNYPEEAKSNESRLQFFNQSWRTVLNQLIDNELILADSERLEIKIPDAKIRETIHERFGPNVMASLDELEITLDEAWKMIYTEMAVQQVSWYRVYKKAQDQIGPEAIKASFKEYLITNPPKEEWKYQVLSIRAKTEQLGNVFAQKAQALIRNEPLPFESLAKILQEGNEDNTATITLSDEYSVESKDLSESHKTVLCNLSEGDYSQPVSQVSRHDNSNVHRIFYLKKHTVEEAPSFDSMTDQLLDDLVQKEITTLMPPYLAKLRKQFNFDAKTLDSIPADFQPFSMR